MTANQPTTHSNFSFLQEHDAVFYQLASSAEQLFASDPHRLYRLNRRLGY